MCGDFRDGVVRPGADAAACHRGRRRSALTAVLTGALLVALLLPVALAWLLWSPRPPGAGDGGASPPGGVVDRASGEVVASLPVEPARARRLPRPERPEPVALRQAGARQPWGERFASTVAAFAGLAFDAARAGPRREGFRDGAGALRAPDRVLDRAPGRLPGRAPGRASIWRAEERDAREPAFRVFGFDVEGVPPPPDAQGPLPSGPGEPEPPNSPDGR